MSPEERDRLVKVEAEVELLKEQLDQANDKLDRLLQAAAMGQGAWWIILRIGGVMVGLAALAAGLATAWRAYKGF